MKLPTLPTPEKLLERFTPRDVCAPYGRAEDDVAKEEQALAQRQADLADHERRVAELPARIARGEVKASTLTDQLRDRDAAALVIATAEQALAKARERLAVETTNAAAAMQREAVRRAEPLERAAAEVAPFLAALRELSLALARAANPLAVGGFVTVSWPCDAVCAADQRQVAASSATIAPFLAWSGSKNRGLT